VVSPIQPDNVEVSRSTLRARRSRPGDRAADDELMTRSSAAESTLASTTMRRPLTSTISIRPLSTAPNGDSRDPLTTSGAKAHSNAREPRDISLPHGLAPRANLARMQPVASRHRADDRPGHQRLVDDLLRVGPTPASPAFDRDNFGSMHRPRSPPIATSRTKPCSPPRMKAGSPSGYASASVAAPESVRRCRSKT
jgi:hypothetical protein